MFGKKRNQEVRDLILKHCGLVGEAVREFVRMVNDYLDADKQFKEDARHIDELESQADKVRFEVEHRMYTGAFLPGQREDFIAVLETLDRVANKAEDAGDFLTLVRPQLPGLIADDLREVARLTQEAFDRLPPLIERVLEGDYEIREPVIEIGRTESRIDRLLFAAVRRVFKEGGLDRAEQMAVMVALDRIGSVSDRIENAGDRLSLIAIKRKLA